MHLASARLDIAEANEATAPWRTTRVKELRTTLLSLQLVRSRIVPLQPLFLTTRSEAHDTPAHAKQEEREQGESATEEKDHSEAKERIAS